MANRRNRNRRGAGQAIVKIVLIVCVLLILAAAGYTVLSGRPDSSAPATPTPPEQTDDGMDAMAGGKDTEETLQPDKESAPPASSTPDVQTTSPSPDPDEPDTSAQPALETAASVGADLPVTVPANGRVDDSYFADAIFVGNSRTEGLKLYGGITGTTFYSEVGLTVTKAFSDRIVNLNGQWLTVAEALQQADYKKVYIMLGMNELGWVYESVFAEDYARIIDVIQQSHPDAEIYVQSIIPVSEWKDGSNDVYTNANVVRLQKVLCEMCLEKGVHYVNVAEVMQDAGGFLPGEATQDGMHLTPEYCKIWADYLRTHTA